MNALIEELKTQMHEYFGSQVVISLRTLLTHIVQYLRLTLHVA
jgi:hypothetical protein